nr:hypothetical protein [Angustibacter aerolatus]
MAAPRRARRRRPRRGARRHRVARRVGRRAWCARCAGWCPARGSSCRLDEPSLPAVLAGHLPTASGYGVLRAIEPGTAERAITDVVDAVHAAGATTAVHCCAPDTPVALLARTGADALSLDTSLLGPNGWESVAAAVEAGTRCWAGVLPTSGPLPGTGQVAGGLVAAWRRVGLPLAGLREVVVTPTCGLAGAAPASARAVLARAVEVAREVDERAQD